MLDALEPFSIVDFAVLPLVDALPVGFAVFVRAMVRVAIVEHFIASAMSSILEPFTLVNTTILIDQDTKPFSLPRRWVELTPVDAVLVLLDAKLWQFAHFFIVKFVTNHLIDLDCIALVLELSISLA